MEGIDHVTLAYKKVYEEWCELRNWEWGPYFRSNNPEKFVELTNYLIQGLDASEIQESNISVPSPWHAAFLLSFVQHQAIENKSNHLLFRGHADSAWSLMPSIDRPYSHPFDMQKRIVESVVFTELLSNLHTDLYMMGAPGSGLNFTLSLPPEAYFAVTQHYGVATHLLDFTADPNVAVFFATRYSEIPSSRESTVYCVCLDQTNSSFEKLSLKLVPPYFHRPYLQKGVFLESSAPSDVQDSFNAEITIKFPYREENTDFKVIRGCQVDLLPHSGEIDILKKLLEGVYERFLIESMETGAENGLNSVEFLAAFARKIAGENEDVLKTLYKEHVRHPFKFFSTFVAELEEMFYWLCYFTQDGEQSGIGLNEQVLALIVRDNIEIMKFFVRIYRFELDEVQHEVPVDKAKRQWMEYLIVKIKDLILENGQDPDEVRSMDSFFGVSS